MMRPVRRGTSRRSPGPGPGCSTPGKTTPGLRALEKAAVRAGGGLNHRHALFDGILVKDTTPRPPAGSARR